VDEEFVFWDERSGRKYGSKYIHSLKGGRVTLNFLIFFYKGHFTLWLKVERLLVFINEIARNLEFGLSTF